MRALSLVSLTAPSAIEVPTSLPGTVGTDLAPADEAGQVIYLAWLPEESVPLEHRKFARRHVDRAARRLRLGHIRVRWFGPAIGEPDFYFVAPSVDALPLGVAPARCREEGCTDPEHNQPLTIALLATARGPMVAATIAHEVRHVAQEVLHSLLGSQAAREQDADGFAAAYARSEGLR